MKVNFPPFFYVKAFWQALAYTISGLLGLLAIFGLVEPQWALTPAALMVIFLGALKWFDVEPQVKMRQMIAEAVAVKAKSGKKNK